MVEAKDCLFCRIGKGDIPSKKVYEDLISMAFLDINPRNPGHTLIIPKKHYETIFQMPEGEGGKFFASLKKVATQVKNGTQAHGLSICQNNGSAAGQVVGHLHFHIIPRFMNEGPSALEALLPVKKMDEKSLDKIAASIKGSSSTKEKPAPAPKTADPPPEAPPKQKKPKESPPEKDEEEDTDEFEEFNF